MRKKVLAFFTCFFVLAFSLFPIVPATASAMPQPNWDDPGMGEIINLADIAAWIQNGVHFDVSQFGNEEDFFNWYYAVRVPYYDDESGMWINPQFGYTKENELVEPFYFHQQNQWNAIMEGTFSANSKYGERFHRMMAEAMLDDGNLSNMVIPLLYGDEMFDFLGGYAAYSDEGWTSLSNYYNQFVSSGSVPEPDPDYQSYIDRINSVGDSTTFFFANYPSTVTYVGPGYDVTAIAFPFYDFTWFGYNPSGVSNIYSGSDVVAHATSKLTLYITSNNGVYSYSTNFDKINFLSRSEWNNTYWDAIQFKYNSPNDPWRNLNQGGITNYSDSYSGTLAQVMSHIATCYKNVNIYVDGVLWGAVYDPDANTVTPEFPDVVGGEELTPITWPVYLPHAPHYINYQGLVNAFRRAKSTDNDLDFDDLIDEIVDENGDPVPDPQITPEPAPLPNPIKPIIPGLPVIPAYNFHSNPGYNGTTVLARIINFTNQSLPSEIVITFWGVVMGAVILGIIKILHK